MSINKDFYEEYENGLTAKVHFMRWLTGIGFLIIPVLIWAAMYFGGKIAVGIIFGLLFLVGLPYIFGGMMYDMKMMNKHGVHYR